MKPIVRQSRIALAGLHGLLIISLFTINLVYNMQLRESPNIVNIFVYSTLSLMAIYLLMAAVLVFRPSGLFPVAAR